MPDDFKRPGTRFILTRVTNGADDGIAECATLVDIVTAIARWYPEETLFAATFAPTSVTFWQANGGGDHVIATMREVFE